MPTICQFYGISIRMYFNDHLPPHFHALYADDELIVGITPIAVLQGDARARVRSLVLEWTALHQAELMANWERCRNAELPLPLEPLV